MEEQQQQEDGEGAGWGVSVSKKQDGARDGAGLKRA